MKTVAYFAATCLMIAACLLPLVVAGLPAGAPLARADDPPPPPPPPQEAAKTANLRNFDWFKVGLDALKGDGKADDTAAIEAALAKFATRGGTLTLPVGRYLVSRTLKVPSGVVVQGEGRPSYNFTDRATMPGAWLVAAEGFDGPILSLDSVHDVTISRIGLDGGDRGPGSKSVGLSIQADSTKDARLATFNITVSECSISLCGTGVAWGRGVAEEQADHVRIDHCDFEGDVVGIRVDSNNAGDYSRIDHGKFAVTDTAVDLVRHGFLAIRGCAAGGPGATFVRRRSWSDNLRIENSQAEGMAAFLLVDGPDDTHTITLSGNSVDCPVRLNTTCRVIGVGNLYQAPLVLGHPGAKYQGIGDRVNASAGGRVDSGGGGRYRNDRLSYADAREPVIAGETVLDEAPASIEMTGGRIEGAADRVLRWVPGSGGRTTTLGRP